MQRQPRVVSTIVPKCSLSATAAEAAVWGVQPSYVRDVANALVNTLNSKEPLGATYHLGGPEVLSYAPLREAAVAGAASFTCTICSLHECVQAFLSTLLSVIAG